jgi:hypothetical protein
MAHVAAFNLSGDDGIGGGGEGSQIALLFPRTPLLGAPFPWTGPLLLPPLTETESYYYKPLSL